MSKAFAIQAQPREALGTAATRRLRREGRVPVVAYGHGQPAKPLLVDAETAHALEHHGGLIEVTVEGSDGMLLAIVKGVQANPITRGVLHIDLQEVRADEKVTATVAIESHGTPKGTHTGGQLEQPLHELEITCLPGDLPESIVVDVTGLELDATLHVGDIRLPDGVAAVSAPDLPVFQVRLPRIEVKAEAAEETETAVAEEEAPEAAEAPEA